MKNKTVKLIRGALDKNTFLGFISLTVISILFVQGAGWCIERILNIAFRQYETLNLSGVGYSVTGIILIFVFCLIYPKTKLNNTKEIKNCASYFAVFLAYTLIVFILYFALNSKISTKITAQKILLSVSAGIWEEAVFRGALISYLLYNLKSKNKALVSVLLTSALFGIMHGANILSGEDLVSAIVQIICTFFFGVFLGAVFIKSKNIWCVIIIHIINDFLSLITFFSADENGIITGKIQAGGTINIALCALLALAGITAYKELYLHRN